MFDIGIQEILLILVIALIVVGPAKLPEMGRSIGKSLKEFRRATSEIKDQLNLGLDEDEPDETPAAWSPPTATVEADPALPSGDRSNGSHVEPTSSGRPEDGEAATT